MNTAIGTFLVKHCDCVVGYTCSELVTKNMQGIISVLHSLSSYIAEPGLISGAIHLTSSPAIGQPVPGGVSLFVSFFSQAGHHCAYAPNSPESVTFYKSVLEVIPLCRIELHIYSFLSVENIK